MSGARKLATIGVLICWDQWYPEGARITALFGCADSCSIPRRSAGIRRRRRTFGDAQVDAWRTAQRAHAIANGVFVASPNRVGFEPEAGTDGIEFFGHSMIVRSVRTLSWRRRDRGRDHSHRAL
jgi:N-carbamoylputrescine amidase